MGRLRPSPLALLVVLLCACQMPWSKSDWREITATSWELVQMEGEPVVGKEVVMLQLEGDSRLFGHGGVNRYFGTYERTGAHGFRAGRIGATKMAGPPGLNRREARFLDLLARVDEVRLTGSGPDMTLELIEHGEPRLSFVPVR